MRLIVKKGQKKYHKIFSVLISVPFLYKVWNAIASGEIYTKIGEAINIADSPATFWSLVGVYLSAALAIMFFGFFRVFEEDDSKENASTK